MWTPKRAVLLTFGGGLFLTFYLVYTHFLGGIDGLPPLPESLVHRPGDPIDLGPPPVSEADRRLKQAFGLGCDELGHIIKLIVPNRGLILASNHAVPESDGRVKLTPFSIAIFRQEHDESKSPEINTAKCEVAYLRFDKPITNIMADIGSRKIIGAELKGKIVITNNRRTAQVADDIEVRVDRSPLYYDEAQSKIWTDGFVTLLDKETRPHPTTIRGEGMDLHLIKEPPAKAGAPQGRPARPKSEMVNGVERVVLRSNVDMHLYTGFLTQDKSDRGPKPGAVDKKLVKPDKSHVVIRTQGRFTYDLTKDVAWFDCAAGKVLPERIHVIQEPLRAEAALKNDNIDQKWNQLLCDNLELQFRRKKPAAGAPKSDERSTDREIESARATARAGNDVTLTMDLENLDAQCAELLYFAPTDARGPQTILKGDNLEVFKDAHRIKARELILFGADQNGNSQQLLAKGPGQVDLYDRNNPAKPYPRHAVWKDLLTYGKTREDKREFDLLTLTQDARFVDEEQKQELQAERLLVWLDPEDRGTAHPKEPPAKQLSTGGVQQRPKKVEGFGRVKVLSPEFIVRECQHLLIVFEDSREVLPEDIARPLQPPMDHKVERPDLGPPLAKEKPKQRKPIELWARAVNAKIVRLGSKNDLRVLIAEGNVHVHQEPSAPEDKGVDIKGEMLTLDHHPSGDVLVVRGERPWSEHQTKTVASERGQAQLQLGELYLLGPKVTINQQKNEAKVDGIGAMHMPSNTTFDGGKPTKPGTRITVHWNQDMFFDGPGASFHGGVVAFQDNSRLTCESLDVTFDKVVSLKEGQKKGEQSAKVQKLNAFGKVYIVDSVRNDKGELVRYQRVTGRQLELDHQEGPGFVTGPGKFYLLQYGMIEPVVQSKEPQPPPVLLPGQKIVAKDKKQEMTLTRVDFDERMFLNNKSEIRRSTFMGNVEVWYWPANDPDVKVDKTKLPKGAMYLECELLEVDSDPQKGGKAKQTMIAQNRVFFRTEDFSGRASKVKYDNVTEQVVFNGTPEYPATLSQVVQQAGRPNTIRGEVIIYNRKTGTFRLDGGREIKWSNQ